MGKKKRNKIVRTATIAASLSILLKGQLKFLNEYYEVVAVSGDDEYLRRVSIDESVRVAGIKMERKISPFKDFISLIKLILFFTREKPILVHSITPKAGLLTMCAAYICRVPIRIHTFTGLIFPTKKGMMKRVLILMDRILCRLATNIYPEGQGVASDLKNFRITSKTLKVINNGNVNGIDIDYFNLERITLAEQEKLRLELSISKDCFVFIFVGRLVRDKGINELVRTFTKLSKESRNIKLLLVGSFEQELDPLFPETISEIHANKDIIFLGYKEDIRPFLAISDVLAFPSYREGFPNVVMQAGAMGLPAIVSDINGCNEIIVDGKNGFIIPSKNENALYVAMKEMKNEEQITNQLSMNARLLITERYSQQEVWAAILQEYQVLITNV